MTDHPDDLFEDFSARPKSVAEIRADREADGRLWTVRDMLISLLRDLDSGVRRPDVAVVALGGVDGEDIHTSFHTAGGNVYVVGGVLMRATHMFNEDPYAGRT